MQTSVTVPKWKKCDSPITRKNHVLASDYKFGLWIQIDFKFYQESICFFESPYSKISKINAQS